MSDLGGEVKNLRRDFNFGSLEEENLPANPIELLKEWLKVAISSKVIDANAFVLGTCVNNEPESRVVLLRAIEDNGLSFFTNYSSKKGQDLQLNPNASVNFFWPELDRQIRVNVIAKKLDEKLSDEYFASRPRESQIGAWASNQSSELKSREILEQRISEIQEQFKGVEVSRPDFWGGYILKPNYFEFWQGRKSRLHDRFTYVKGDGQWIIQRLYP